MLFSFNFFRTFSKLKFELKRLLLIYKNGHIKKSNPLWLYLQLPVILLKFQQLLNTFKLIF
jgi:hypothetical protein